MKIIKPKGYWKVKENCIASAKEYRIRSEWKVSCSGAYEHARRYGWLDECCKHMTRSPHKPHGYWTKERCIEDAKNYKMRSEWKKNSGRAVALARKNGFFDECISHMKIKKYKPNGYWNLKENVHNEAKKYKHKIDWQNFSRQSYQSAMKNGWLDELSTHMEPLGDRFNRMVYCYVFPDKSVYVGLTSNEDRRKNDHLGIASWKYETAVSKHKKKTNLSPEYIKICDYVSDIESQKIESETIEQYRKMGFKILNKSKAGSLGSPREIFWTKERCIEDAKNYKMRSEWVKNSSGAYDAAHKNKWLDECCEHMISPRKPTGYWLIKENCIADAKQYKTRSEWRKKSGGAYSVSCKNGWLDECFSDSKSITYKPYGYWTKERCIEDAKKCDMRSKWGKKSGGAYNVARKNGWMDECFPPKKATDYYNITT